MANKEYIERNALLQEANKNCAEAHRERCAQILEAILNASAADVVEVRHGKWIEVDDGVQIGDGKHLECSECGVWKKDRQKSNFCPHCGAKMDKES